MFANAGFHYHGRIIEEDGAPIANANIVVYDESSFKIGTSTGLYSRTFETGNDGSFAFDLDYGKYNLAFSKGGYVTEEREYNEVNIPDVNVGNVTLLRSVALIVSTSSVVIPPGGVRTTQLQITNRGTDTESVRLSTLSTQGYATQIRDAEGEVLAVTLAPGATRNLNLIVEVQAGQTSGDITIRAEGRVTALSTLSVTVSGEQSKIITCEYPSKQRASGGKADYSMIVTNPLPTPTTINLSKGGIPEDWKATLLNTHGESVRSVYLTAGQDVEITLHVEIPASTDTGTFSPYVEAQMGGRVDRLELALDVEHNVVELGMITWYPVQLIEQGKTASFPLILTNPSESDEVLILSTKFLPDKWGADFTNNVGAIIRSILLQAGDKETVTLVLSPPYDVKPNNYDVRIEAASPTLVGNLTVRVGVVGKTDMKATMGNLFGQVAVGERRTFEVKVKNTGFNTITYPRLDAEASVSSIAVETSPLDVKTIQPGDEMSFTVTATPLEGTPQGDYIIEVRAISTEMRTDPLQIRLTVQANSNQTLTVVAVVAVALVSVLLVYRKFKRR